MGEIIFVSGGARSGKSSFAESIARDLDRETCYIATSIPFDGGMKERVRKHRESRPSKWKTIEQYSDFASLEKNEDFLKSNVILLDCVTIMVSNMMFDSGIDFELEQYRQIEKLEKEIKSEVATLLDLVASYDKTIILVTNEVGFGIVPDNRLSAQFRDIAGRINQYIAKRADCVYMVFMGIESRIK